MDGSLAASWHGGASLAIAAFTLAGVAFGRLPGLPLDRAGFALLGATLLILSGILDVHHAVALIDAEVMAMLLGLMLLNEALAEAGFFRALTARVTRAATGPLGLLVGLVIASGTLSALFLNDTVVLMLTPFVIAVTRRLGLPPLPYLLALATAANVGSVATVTGNPQNVIASAAGGIGYLEFAAALAPVAAIGLVVVAGVIAVVHRRSVLGRRRLAPAAGDDAVPPALPRALTGLVVAMLAALVAGAPVAPTTLVTGVLALLVSGAARPPLLRRVDWPLLVLFAGLFVVVGALQTTGVVSDVLAGLGPPSAWSHGRLVALAAALSNLVSNVPAVMLLMPVVSELEDATAALLATAMAATLAGNFTLVGSVANLIVAELARRHGVHVGFWPYLAVGAPVTLLTLAIGTVLTAP